MRLLPYLLALLLAVLSPARAAEVFPGVKRILFLGDSITHAGGYVHNFEAFLAAQYPDRDFTVINCGLGSETVSGLSEPGHAGGQFPRPDLHERLDRVLKLTKPDLVFANYGMNCGIYLPVDADRFAGYQNGTRKLRAAVEAAGAKIIHLTPPIYDPGATKPKFDYNDVLDHYSKWLLEMKTKEGWSVVDVHFPMAEAVAAQRKSNPSFTYSKDKVHPNAEGHLVMARAIVEGLFPDKLKNFDALFAKTSIEKNKAFFSAVNQRSTVLGDSYRHTAGHKRPGVAKGLPLEEALDKAKALSKTVRETAPKL